MKYFGKRLMLGTGLVAVLMLVGVTRTRAVQEWYHTVTVKGRVTMFLLDDHARVNGLLLDGGSQVRLAPRLAEAVVARAKTGDAVSVVGRGGQSSSFGRAVHARELTINGQTLTAFDEPRHGPPTGPPGSHGPRGPRGDAPPPSPGDAPPPPHDAGRGHVPPPPPPPGAAGAAAPPSGAGVAEPGADNPPAHPAPTPGPGAQPDAPPPPPVPESQRVTARSKVQAFLVGERGEVIGLALDSGEQVHFAPRVGEALAAQSAGAHPDVVVEGDAVRSERGTIIRATQLTVGTRTLILP